jgi:PPOX class probable F420-dependent enzyme
VSSPNKESDQRSPDASDALGALHDAKYLNLESYRRSGASVRTPVWFAASSENSPASDIRTFFLYSTADSGKAKRIRRCASVRVAACDVRGKVSAPWTDARAEDGDPRLISAILRDVGKALIKVEPSIDHETPITSLLDDLPEIADCEPTVPVEAHDDHWPKTGRDPEKADALDGLPDRVLI